MTDLISRQMAIDAIADLYNTDERLLNHKDEFNKIHYMLSSQSMPTALTSSQNSATQGRVETAKCITSNPYTGNVSVSLEDKIEEVLRRLAPPEFAALKCRECGGQITQKWDDHIVKCPYCKTVYVVGRKMLNG